jgi:hypothetical protein
MQKAYITKYTVKDFVKISRMIIKMTSSSRALALLN